MSCLALYQQNILKGAKVSETEQPPSDTQSAAAHCLKLPGKKLYLTPLNNAKRFRNFGYKKGALKAFEAADGRIGGSGHRNS